MDSSVWCESKDVKILWITFLAKKDKNGFVAASVPGMAKSAGLTVAECLSALKILEGPDALSSSQEHEGRRLRKVEHGWVVLNHFVYRDLVSKARQRDYNRVKQLEYRKKVKEEFQMLKAAAKLQKHELEQNGNPTAEEVEQLRDNVTAALMPEEHLPEACR